MNNEEFKQKVRREVMDKYKNINSMSVRDVEGELIYVEMEIQEINDSIKEGRVTGYKVSSAKSKIKFLTFEKMLLVRELDARLKKGRDIDKKRANDKDQVIKHLEAHISKLESTIEDQAGQLLAARLELVTENDKLKKLIEEKDSDIDLLIVKLKNIALHQ